MKILLRNFTMKLIQIQIQTRAHKDWSITTSNLRLGTLVVGDGLYLSSRVELMTKAK